MLDEEEYTFLVYKALSLGIDWDFNYIDPVGLEQEIENFISKERKFEAENYKYYLDKC